MKRVLLPCLAVVALFLALVALRVKDNYATLPNPLKVDLVLARGVAGRADPLIVAGETGRGDFLSLRFVDDHTITLVYDSWGHPGITSQPIPVQPGVRLPLQIEIPALDQVVAGIAPPSDRVRILANGARVLDTVGHFYPRDSERIYFAENPLGGTACGTTLRGLIIADNGRALRGTPGGTFPPRDQLFNWLRNWLRHSPHQVVSLLLISIAMVAGARLLATRGPTLRAAARSLIRHRWFVGTALVASIGFAWLVTLGSFRFNEREVFGSFYDYQAASFLQGRLDVPEEAIGGEAFEAHGKLYGYFGPTPALLRLPFVLSGFAFGKLSRTFMQAYFVASLLAAYLILCDAVRRARRAPEPATPGDDPLPSPLAVGVLIGSVGWGSTIFFLGSRGLIFHEAILGGIAFALWSGWCSLRHLDQPGRRWWIGALGCGILSVHTRPPTGLFALTLLGCVVIAIALRERRQEAANARARTLLPANFRRHLAIAGLCAAGVLSLNGLAYLKFGLFDAAPLRISRPYANSDRLARIDGKSFHLVNLPFNFYTYLVRPNFRLEHGFPWIYLGSPKPGHFFPAAKIDLPDHTLALPYAMPSLCLLATIGCLGGLLTAPGLRPAIAAIWAAALPMTLALFAAVATAQRYTGDFCPVLICAAAHGLVGIEGARAAWRRIFQPVIILTTLAAIAVTVALTLHYQGDYLWGVPEETRLNYQLLRQRVDRFFGSDAPRQS